MKKLVLIPTRLHCPLTQITIKTSITQERDLDIICPCFMVDKDSRSHIAVIDENTVIKTYKSDDDSYMLATKGTVDFFKSDVVNAHDTWHSCTEEAFFEVLADIQIKTALKPALVEQNIYSNLI